MMKHDVWRGQVATLASPSSQRRGQLCAQVSADNLNDEYVSMPIESVAALKDDRDVAEQRADLRERDVGVVSLIFTGHMSHMSRFSMDSWIHIDSEHLDHGSFPQISPDSECCWGS